MGLSVKSEVIFGIKGTVDITTEEEKELSNMGVTVSPCTYREDERTDRVIVGISLASLSNVDETDEVAELSDFEKEKMREKIIEALLKIDVDIPEHKPFKMYLNSDYY